MLSIYSKESNFPKNNKVDDNNSNETTLLSVSPNKNQRRYNFKKCLIIMKRTTRKL